MSPRGLSIVRAFGLKQTGAPWAQVAAVALVFLFATSPGEAFEEDFHYYGVYFILRAKGYPPASAHELAGFSQYVDDCSYSEPLFCYAGKRAQFHFAGSTPRKPTVPLAKQALLELNGAFLNYQISPAQGKYLVGAALHLLADTYSHKDFTAWWSWTINWRSASIRPCIGHADDYENGHYPDRPYNDAPNALAAAHAIYLNVPDYPGGTILPWTTVEARLRTAFALPANGARDRQGIWVRVDAMRAVILQQFHEATGYEKEEFANEKALFVAAIK